MTDDIVKRLWRMADMTSADNDLSDITIAANYIVELRAEIQQLKQDSTIFIIERSDAISQNADLREENTELRGEIAALPRLQGRRPMTDKTCPEADNCAMHITAAAHKAKQLQEQKRAVYTERNRLVAFIASLYPSGIKDTAILGWDEAWNGCVYIDLPNGQASWHYHESQANMFAHLPRYEGEWDGHTTEEKYNRIAALELRSYFGEAND